jgi:hypothetical protein
MTPPVIIKGNSLLQRDSQGGSSGEIINLRVNFESQDEEKKLYD